MRIYQQHGYQLVPKVYEDCLVLTVPEFKRCMGLVSMVFAHLSLSTLSALTVACLSDLYDLVDFWCCGQ